MAVKKRTMVNVLNAVLALGLAYVVVDTALGWRPALHAAQVDNEAVEPTPTSTTGTVTPEQVAAIFERDLFQIRQNQEPNAGPRPIRDPPQPGRADLLLVGTVAGNTEVARAIIGRNGDRPAIYKIGDEIDGARIDEIGRRRVVLSRAGTTRTLEIAQQYQQPASTPSAARGDRREAIRARRAARGRAGKADRD